MKKHEIHYCDSMAGNGSTALSILLDYLKDESISKRGIASCSRLKNII